MGLSIRASGREHILFLRKGWVLIVTVDVLFVEKDMTCRGVQQLAMLLRMPSPQNRGSCPGRIVLQAHIKNIAHGIGVSVMQETVPLRLTCPVAIE